MNTNTTTAEVHVYLREIEAHLDDLSPGQRAELLEDLELHLHEVAAEGEGGLEERLGPPAAYAAELRSSAGLPARGVRRARRTIRERAGALTRWPVVRSVAAFLPELRPGWWVLRGYVLVSAFAVLSWTNSPRDFPIPPLAGSRLLALVMIAAAAWASVALGRRAARGWARGASWVANVAVIVAGLAAVSSVQATSARPWYDRPYPPDFVGNPLVEQCAYASDGTPLSDVLIFDSSGRPAGAPASCPALTKVEVSAVNGPTWIEATAPKALFFRGTLQPGETKTFLAPIVGIVIGNASAARLVVDGRDAGPLGGPGQVYRGVFGPQASLPPFAPGDSPPSPTAVP